MRERGERGSAVVDFVLICLVLIPLVFGIMQVALVMYVRTTLTAAATEGARYGATIDRGPAAGAAHTRAQVGKALSGRFADGVSAYRSSTAGVPTVVVAIRARVPPLGLWGPSVRLDVRGHAVQETLR